MNIMVRRNGRKWLAEVWAEDPEQSWTGFNEPYPEEKYVEINSWCQDTFGYPARTAYHVFEFKKQSDLEFFILKWN